MQKNTATRKNDLPLHLLFILIAAIGIMIRTIEFPQHPGGLNQDEASIGYDAYALLKAGIDRNGCSFPVHLIAWGSGQNALYAYLSMPFIAIFGLNVFSVRCVNLIFSILSMFAVYSVFRRTYDKQAGLLAMALTAIAPWNIMLGRWGLESNLFPSLLVLCLWAVERSFEKPRFLYLAAFLFAITMYSYGAAYLVITVLLVLLAAAYFYCLIRKKRLTESKLMREVFPLSKMIGPAILFLIVSAPIYLFMYVNVFDHDTIKLGFITIPHTYGERIATSFGTTLSEALHNLMQYCLEQFDGADRNAFPFYGCIYTISLPFTLLGIVSTLRSRKPFGIVLLLTLISSLMLFAYYAQTNINRVNAIYFPLLLFTALGIYEISANREALSAILLAYMICFGGFFGRYFNADYRKGLSEVFYASFGDAIQYADSTASEKDTIFVAAQVDMAYIYTLFYTQYDPHQFVDTVKYDNPGDQFQTVASYGNYVFDHDKLTSGEKGVYIINNWQIEAIQKYTDEIKEFKYFSVAIVR